MIGELQIPLWEWWIVGYFFLGGIAGGGYFTATVIELVGGPDDIPAARIAYLMAFPLALVCGVFLVLDLGEPLRFWHMIVYSKTFLPWPVWDSPISVGAYALLGFSFFAFVSFVDAWLHPHRRSTSLLRKLFAIPGAFFGLFLSSYTGVLLAHTHLPIWANTPMLGALFAASAASTGMAAIALGLALTKKSRSESEGTVHAKLKQADTVAMILELVLLIIFLVWLGGAAIPILTGLNGILLVGGTMLVGLLIPIAMQFRSASHKEKTGVESATSQTTLIALLVLIGGLLMRTVIVMGGQGFL